MGMGMEGESEDAARTTKSAVKAREMRRARDGDGENVMGRQDSSSEMDGATDQGSSGLLSRGGV